MAKNKIGKTEEKPSKVEDRLRQLTQVSLRRNAGSSTQENRDRDTIDSLETWGELGMLKQNDPFIKKGNHSLIKEKRKETEEGGCCQSQKSLIRPKSSGKVSQAQRKSMGTTLNSLTIPNDSGTHFSQYNSFDSKSKSKLILSTAEFVESEFNHVRGPGTFTRSIRNFYNLSTSPGPGLISLFFFELGRNWWFLKETGKYEKELSLEKVLKSQSKGGVIPKTAKKSIFDKQKDQSESLFYPSFHFVSMPYKK